MQDLGLLEVAWEKREYVHTELLKIQGSCLTAQSLPLWPDLSLRDLLWTAEIVSLDDRARWRRWEQWSRSEGVTWEGMAAGELPRTEHCALAVFAT